MDFTLIEGQQNIVKAIENAFISGNLPHGWLFCGNFGTGRRTFAGIFANVLLCTSPDGLVPCGTCMACRLYREKTTPDFIHIVSDEKGISVDTIRESIKEMYVKPVYSAKKVLLIEDGEQMTPQAQNALLKTLEEPPGEGMVIMTATKPDALIETVVSRLMCFNLAPLPPDKIKEILYKKYGNSKDIESVMALSDGALGRAYEIMEDRAFQKMRDELFVNTGMLMSDQKSKIYRVLKWLEDNKDSMDLILTQFIYIYRDMLIYKITNDFSICANKDFEGVIKKGSKKYSIEGLVKKIEKIRQTGTELDSYANFRLASEVLLLTLYEEKVE